MCFGEDGDPFGRIFSCRESSKMYSHPFQRTLLDVSMKEDLWLGGLSSLLKRILQVPF